MTLFRVALPTVLSVFALSTIAQDQTVDLSWKPVVGPVGTYRMTSDMAIDAGGMQMEIQVQVVLSNKVTKFESEKVTMESEMKSFQLTMNGETMDGPPGGEAPTGQKITSVYALDGSLISTDNPDPMSGGPRVERLASFHHPKEPIKIGSEWFKEVPAMKDKQVPPGKYKYTLEAAEVLNGVAAYRIKYAYSEMEGDLPFGAVGTMWLNQKDRSLIKMEATYENIQYVPEMPPVNAKVKLERIGD